APSVPSSRPRSVSPPQIHRWTETDLRSHARSSPHARNQELPQRPPAPARRRRPGSSRNTPQRVVSSSRFHRDRRREHQAHDGPSDFEVALRDILRRAVLESQRDYPITIHYPCLVRAGSLLAEVSFAHPNESQLDDSSAQQPSPRSDLPPDLRTPNHRACCTTGHSLTSVHKAREQVPRPHR